MSLYRVVFITPDNQRMSEVASGTTVDEVLEELIQTDQKLQHTGMEREGSLEFQKYDSEVNCWVQAEVKFSE